MAVFGDVMAVLWCSAMLWRCYGGVRRCYGVMVFGDVMAVLWRVMAVLWRCSAMFGDVRRDYDGTWMTP